MRQDTDQMMASVQECFDELKPAIQEVSRMVRTAPLDKAERIGLALMVAAHFTGDVAGAMEKHPSECAREIAFGIAETIAKAAH